MTTLLAAFNTLSPLSQEALLSDLVFNYSVNGSWHTNANDYGGNIEKAAKDIFGGAFGDAAAKEIPHRL
jgi:hypothetical protein